MADTELILDQAVVEHCRALGVRPVGWSLLVGTLEQRGDSTSSGVTVIAGRHTSEAFAQSLVDVAATRPAVPARQA